MESSRDAYNSLKAFKSRDLNSTMSEAETRYGVGAQRDRVTNLRGLVGNLQSAVEAVDPSVTGRTTGTFTTEGQRQALVNRERTPILGDLAKQQVALGQGEQGLNESLNQASNYANVLFNQDRDQYQRLLDRYNSTLAAEAEAERVRQFNEQQALAREQMAAQERANKAAQGAGAGSYLSALLNGPKTLSTATVKKAAAVSPQIQTLFNQMFYRGDGTAWDDRSLISDYQATLKSAQYGNARDKQKIELYHRNRPDLFGKSIPIAAVGNGGALSF